MTSQTRLKRTIIVTLCGLILSTSQANAALDPDDGNPLVITSHRFKSVSVPREDALLDPMDRVSDEFKVPKELMQRTAFWFDIYTKYTGRQHVIHHIQYPWVVFKIFDTTPIFNSPGNYWAKHARADAAVKNETNRVIKALVRISKTKNLSKLTDFEKNVLRSLSSIKGSRQKVAKIAAKNIRSQLGQRDFFISGLKSSKKYLPLIEKDFEANGLPTELCRLPFVESSFNIEAQSKVGASGIWQIMPTTGKNYLRVDELIDERNSPLKASLAAIEIFKENYRILKSWPLAVTAYNHGPGGIRRGMRLTNSDSLAQLIKNYKNPSFQFASANFYTSFLAALHAEKYNNEIFGDVVGDSDENLTIEHQVVVLRKPVRLNSLAKKIGISPELLVEYNYDLKRAARKNAKLPKGYKLILPSDEDFFNSRKLSSHAGLIKEASL